MKKIYKLMIVFCTIFIILFNVVYVKGTTGDGANIVTLFTINQSQFTVYEKYSDEWTPSRIQLYKDEIYPDIYPFATVIGDPTSKYNCHSYAWLQNNNNYNKYWLDNPSVFYSDGSYEEVQMGRIGDIICYFDDKGTVDVSDDENIHSGIISGLSGLSLSNNVCGDANKYIVKSKWGDMALFEHRGDYCLYTTALTSTTLKAEYIKIYRPRTHGSYTLSNYSSVNIEIFGTNFEYDNTNNYEMYSINCEYTKNYIFKILTSLEFEVILYDEVLTELEYDDMDSTNSLIYFEQLLQEGKNYYLKVLCYEQDAGIINILINSTDGKYLDLGVNNIPLENYSNTANYIFTNNYETGLYNVKLSSNISNHIGTIKVYKDENKTELVKRMETSLYTLDAITDVNCNNLILYLEEGESYYIDISLPDNNLHYLYLNINLIDDGYGIDLSNNTTEYVIFQSETELGDKFEKIIISDDLGIFVTYVYSGSQSETIYFVLYKEVYNDIQQKFELQLVFPEMMVPYGESLQYATNITAGTYYIGYYNKTNNTSTITITVE